MLEKRMCEARMEVLANRLSTAISTNPAAINVIIQAIEEAGKCFDSYIVGMTAVLDRIEAEFRDLPPV